MDAMLEALWALWAGDLDLPLEDSDLSLAFDRASFKMMGARDGRGGPGATEIGAAGNLGRAAAATGAEFENRPGGNGGLRGADTSGWKCEDEACTLAITSGVAGRGEEDKVPEDRDKLPPTK